MVVGGGGVSKEHGRCGSGGGGVEGAWSMW